MTPFTPKRYRDIHGKVEDIKYVPCGKCPECIARRVSGWSFRLLREGLYSESAYFITLTYDTDHVPITKRGYMALSKRDIQLFFKRLRKLHIKNEKPIKYYAVGEYGSDRYRPHYHIIAFNIELQLIMSKTDRKILEYTNYDGKTHVNILPWTIKKQSLGTVTFGSVSGASIGYCMKYLSKPSRIPMHQNDDRQKEFALMSKGLGAGYLTPGILAWHKADLENRMYLNIENNKKISMPRYYKDKIYSLEERQIIADTYKAIQELETKEYYENFDPILDYNNAIAVKAAFKRMNYRSQDSQGRL